MDAQWSLSLIATISACDQLFIQHSARHLLLITADIPAIPDILTGGYRKRGWGLETMLANEEDIKEGPEVPDKLN